MITIEILKKLTPQDLKDINRLIPQIADRPHLLTMRELKRVISQDSCRLIVARMKKEGRNRIVGMSAVTLVYVPTGLITMIEDVVVDKDARGFGIGKKLTKKMISVVTQKRAKHISLTTNPKNKASNDMYKNLQFFLKKTNFYRINLFLPKPTDKKEVERRTDLKRPWQ